mgnify:CR=1 FL=1
MFDELSNYEQKGPGGVGETIDRNIAGSTPCPKCGGEMHYEGYTNPVTGSYRAFAVCNECDNRVEF